MRKFTYFIVITVIVQSCTSHMVSRVPILCEDEFYELYSAKPAGRGLSIVGRARVEVPRYRVRGVFHIQYVPPDELRIDFQHSSLFGAHREDISILLKGGEMNLYDHQRGEFFGNDSSIAIISRSLGFDVYPDDILYALLLDAPECSDIDAPEIEGSEGDWKLTGDWRGRCIEITGKKGEGPVKFRQCSSDGTRCYIISYNYSRARRGLSLERPGKSYPQKIFITREGGTERMSIEITRVDLEDLPADDLGTG